jgi:hypothetical protein
MPAFACGVLALLIAAGIYFAFRFSSGLKKEK